MKGATTKLKLVSLSWYDCSVDRVHVITENDIFSKYDTNVNLITLCVSYVIVWYCKYQGLVNRSVSLYDFYAVIQIYQMRKCSY